MVQELYLCSAFLVFQLLKVLLLHKSALTHSHTLKAGDFSTKSQPAHQELIQQWHSYWEQFGSQWLSFSSAITCPRSLPLSPRYDVTPQHHVSDRLKGL